MGTVFEFSENHWGGAGMVAYIRVCQLRCIVETNSTTQRSDTTYRWIQGGPASSSPSVSNGL